MEKVSGKYYWVRTEQGKEIAYQRYSGQWELCGISAGENVNDAILEVIREVANDVSDTAEPCALLDVVGRSEQFTPKQLYMLAKKHSIQDFQKILKEAPTWKG